MRFEELIQNAAVEAGKIHTKYFQSGFVAERKSSSFDLVTAADIESEKAITELIRQWYPDHNILGEEAVYEQTASEYTWIIDPLDGTNNFACKIPIFCVSIGLMKGSEIILGVVYDAMRDELFFAQKGRGATLNGRPITVNSVASFEDALLITGFYYDRGDDMIKTLEMIKRFFLQRILGLRRFGAAALDLCYVACGRAAGFWEFELSPWDFAAGKLIVEEAQGKVTGRFGEELKQLEKSFVVASNGNIHSAMLATLSKD